MSGSTQSCEDVIGRLIAALRQGADVSTGDRQHVATCPDCSRMIAAAGRLEDELEVDVPVAGTEERFSLVAREAEAALRLERRRSAAFLILGGLAVLIPSLMAPGWKIIQGFGVLVGLGAIGSVILRRLNEGRRGLKLYKRIKRQWVFGVCRGLAEAAEFPVAVIRLGVMAPMLLGKSGWMIAIALYLLLDMSLEVHPEDRGLLLRFRFRRWLESVSTRRAEGPPATTSETER